MEGLILHRQGLPHEHEPNGDGDGDDDSSSMRSLGLHAVVQRNALYQLDTTKGLIPLEKEPSQGSVIHVLGDLKTPSPSLKSLKKLQHKVDAKDGAITVNVVWDTNNEKLGSDNNILGDNVVMVLPNDSVRLPLRKATPSSLAEYGAKLLRHSGMDLYMVFGDGDGVQMMVEMLLMKAGRAMVIVISMGNATVMVMVNSRRCRSIRIPSNALASVRDEHWRDM